MKGWETMKKFISLLAVFAMLVSIFAVSPAQAEDALTGTFNIPEKSMSVLETQEIYFNFNRELTDAEAASITASCKMAEAASSGSDPWLNKTLAKVASNKGTLKTEITDDKKAVKVYFIVSGKIGWLWSGSNGNIWQITVNVNGEELGALNFATRNKKTLE